MVDVVSTTPAHVAELAGNLRSADLRELRAAGHRDLLVAIQRSVALSTHLATALHLGEVVAIFGAAPISMIGGVGCPWMLGTPLVTRHARALMKISPPYIAAMLRAYPTLVNIVHAENQWSKRWLSRAGFALAPASPHPITGAPFHRFEMRA